MADDQVFMARALALAAHGQLFVAPNPMVGCVIVHNGHVIGEGWHKQYGQAHAEVNAINQVNDKDLLKQSTLYVSLEPCAHFGKTPPCVELILNMKIPKVVICNEDPNHLVAGKGINILRQHGVEVSVGLLKKEGRYLNRRFFTFQENKRPYVILKWAESSDGFIAKSNGDSKWISGELSRMRVHQWRAEEAAIVVGTNTALRDNPSLTVRNWSGSSPVRVLIDKALKVDSTYNIFNDQSKTIIFNQEKDDKNGHLEWIKLDFSQSIIKPMLQELYDRNLQSLIVEGGTQLINSFLETGQWDEIRRFKSKSVEFRSGIEAPHVRGSLIDEESIENDELNIYLAQGLV